MEFFRLFTAVRPPTNILDAIEALQARFRNQVDSDSVRWIGRENMHITLQFLGDTAADRVEDVIDAMAGGVLGGDGGLEIHLTLGGVGAFPNARRPRVVWIGVQDLSGELSSLQQSIGRILRERGFRLDNKSFRPHITLGYVRGRATQEAIRAITSAVQAFQAEAGAAAFTASELLLVRSTLSPSGAVYSDLHSLPLTSASKSTSSGESARE